MDPLRINEEYLLGKIGVGTNGVKEKI